MLQVGVDPDGRLRAVDVQVYINAGNTYDLSLSVSQSMLSYVLIPLEN